MYGVKIYAVGVVTESWRDKAPRMQAVNNLAIVFYSAFPGLVKMLAIFNGASGEP
jgi:hypothetical protein